MLSAKRSFSFRGLRTKKHDCPPSPSAAAEPTTSKPPTLEQLAGIAWEGGGHDGSSSDNSSNSNGNGNKNDNNNNKNRGNSKCHDDVTTTAELGASQHSLHSSKEKERKKKKKKKKKHDKKERTVDQDTSNREEKSGDGGGDGGAQEEEKTRRRKKKKEKRKKKRDGLDSVQSADVSDISSPAQENCTPPTSPSRPSSQQLRPPRSPRRRAPPQRSTSLPVSVKEKRDPSALLEHLLTQESSSTRRVPQSSSEYAQQWQQQRPPRAESRRSHLNAAPSSLNSSYHSLLKPSSDHGPDEEQLRQWEHARRRSHSDVGVLVDDQHEPITPPQALPQLYGGRGKGPPLPGIASVNPRPAASNSPGEADNSSSNDEDSLNSNRTESGDEGDWEEAISTASALRSKAAAGNLFSIPCIPNTKSNKSDPPSSPCTARRNSHKSDPPEEGGGGGGEEKPAKAPADSFDYFNIPSASRNDSDKLQFNYSNSDASLQSIATIDASDDEGGDGNDRRVFQNNATRRPRHTPEQLQQQIRTMHVQFQQLLSAKVHAEMRAQRLETDLAAIQKERDAAFASLREEKDDAEMKAHQLETDLVSLREERDAEFVRLSEEMERWRRAAQEEGVRRERERCDRDALEEKMKALEGENLHLKLMLERISRNTPAQSGKGKGVMVTRLEERFSRSSDESSLSHSFRSSRTAAQTSTPKGNSPRRGHKPRRHSTNTTLLTPDRPSDTPPQRSSSDPIESDSEPHGQAPASPSPNQLRGRSPSRDSACPSSKSGVPQAPRSWHGGKIKKPSALGSMPMGIMSPPLTGGSPKGKMATVTSSNARSLLRRKNSASTAPTVRSSMGTVSTFRSSMDSMHQDSFSNFNASLGDVGFGLSVGSSGGVAFSMEDHVNSVLMEEADNYSDGMDDTVRSGPL